MMTTKLTSNEQQILIDYLNYWAKVYQLDIFDKLDCGITLLRLVNKFPIEKLMNDPSLIVNMIVMIYICNKADNSEEED